MQFHEYVKKYSVTAGIIFPLVIISIIIFVAISSGKKISEHQTTGRVLAVTTASGSFGNINQILVEVEGSDDPLTIIVGDRFYRKGQIVTLSCSEFESKAISCHVQDLYLNK